MLLDFIPFKYFSAAFSTAIDIKYNF